MYAALRYTFGSSWIRTSEGINQRIYNPPPLTTRTPTPKAHIAPLSEWQDSNLRPHLPKRRALPNCATLRSYTCTWDGRIRTFDTRNQKPTPCHLATPHTRYNTYVCFWHSIMQSGISNNHCPIRKYIRMGVHLSKLGPYF